jgi:hypothetical protein
LQRDGARTVQKLDRCRSRRFSVIEVEHPAESLPPLHDPIISSNAGRRPNLPIAKSLMIAFRMVMFKVSHNCTAQRCLPDEDY